MNDTGHRTYSDQIVQPAAIVGWSWGFDETDYTWSVFCTGLPESVVAWRRLGRKDDGPEADPLRIVVCGDVPTEIVAAVYAANRKGLMTET